MYIAPSPSPSVADWSPTQTTASLNSTQCFTVPVYTGPSPLNLGATWSKSFVPDLGPPRIWTWRPQSLSLSVPQSPPHMRVLITTIPTSGHWEDESRGTYKVLGRYLTQNTQKSTILTWVNSWKDVWKCPRIKYFSIFFFRRSAKTTRQQTKQLCSD